MTPSEQEQPAAHGVRIDARPGHAAISIDGTPIPQGQVTGYTLHHSIARELPTLVLHTRQPDGVLWEGLAHVAVAVDKPVSQTIIAFLAQIDPVDLDRAALNRTDYGGHKGDTARAMLQTLAEWAREAEQ